MSKRICITPRFWLIAIILILICCIPMYLVAESKKQVLMERYESLVQERDVLREDVIAMEADLEYLKTDQGIEQYARAAGMIKPGEVQFVAGAAQ